jgi:hypothetical protein
MGTDLVIIDNENVEHVERITWLRDLDEIHLCFANRNIQEAIAYCTKRYEELTRIHLYEVKKCKMIDYLRNCQYPDSLHLVTDRDLLINEHDCDHDHFGSTRNRFAHLLHILQDYENDCKLLSISY